jgi:hypothetical protein
MPNHSPVAREDTFFADVGKPKYFDVAFLLPERKYTTHEIHCRMKLNFRDEHWRLVISDVSPVAPLQTETNAFLSLLK